MFIPRNSVRKFVIDYMCNSQECSLTLHYGFALGAPRASEPSSIAAFLLSFWMPKLQAWIGDQGFIGGGRVYCPHEPHFGAGAAHGQTVPNPEVSQGFSPAFAVLLRAFQVDRPSKIQKRVYLPVPSESAVVQSTLVVSGAQGNALQAIRTALFTRIGVPFGGVGANAIPCVPTRSIVGVAPGEDVSYWSLEDATYTTRLAQRRSRQLRNQFAWDAAGAFVSADPGDGGFGTPDGGQDFDRIPPTVVMPPLPGFPSAL
jgi:hypothetical protein